MKIKKLKGSGRSNPDKKVAVKARGAADEAVMEVKLILQHGKNHPKEEHLSRKAFLARLGPDEEAIEKVREFAEVAGLEITDINRLHRKVTLRGTLPQMEKAFHTSLHEFEHPEGNYISHESEIHLPKDLHKYVIGLIGLHNRPVSKPRLAENLEKQTPAEIEESPAAPQFYNGFPTDLAKLYDFPDDLDGSGQTIALIQLGGGYKTEDLEVYFKNLKMNTPDMLDYSVNGGQNQPTNPEDMKTREVYTDIYMAGATAPKARLLLYFAPSNRLHDISEAFYAAIYDDKNFPDIISCSWGAAEKEWNDNDIQILETALEDAKKMGITAFAASGDGGSSDEAAGLNVDYPASSPQVVGCGGTVAYVNARQTTILKEVVWNRQGGSPGATGGGVSEEFPLPEWQRCADVPKQGRKKRRGVPDMAGVAGFHKIYLFGNYDVEGGTSCVAPMLAGLMAMANQKAGQNLGFILEAVYRGQLEEDKELFFVITEGNNGAYSANDTWCACTGLGRPFGKRLVDYLVSSLSSKTQ